MAFTEKLLFLRLIQAMSSKFRLIKKLDVKVRERYLKKISTIGIDPVLIYGERFKPDCLLPVESTDLLCYLVLCRALFATFKDISSEQARGVAKVRHSQRMNDALIQIWMGL